MKSPIDRLMALADEAGMLADIQEFLEKEQGGLQTLGELTSFQFEASTIIPPFSEPAPCAEIVADEGKLTLFYYMPLEKGERCAVLDFSGYQGFHMSQVGSDDLPAHYFDLVGDIAFGADASTGFALVTNLGNWVLDSLGSGNKLRSLQAPDMQHFIFHFRDRTFEIIASEVGVMTVDGDMATAFEVWESHQGDQQ